MLDNDSVDVNYKLFKLVFNNIVISKYIYDYIKYYKNRRVKFNSLKELKNYNQKEYIRELVYNSKEKLQYGDLPTNGTLKEITFKIGCPIQNGDVIPYGVEVINYCMYDSYTSFIFTPTTRFSQLPSSVHTLNNVVLPFSIQGNEIPPNITSISFNRCFNISGYPDEFSSPIRIPNTIKTLKFNPISQWNNCGLPIRVGDIPEGITNLSIKNIILETMEQGALPNSIIELGAILTNRNNTNLSEIFPPNLEILDANIEGPLIPSYRLSQCTSIKKFTLQYPNYVEPLSLPPNITDLKITKISRSPIEPNTIPNIVTNLCLHCSTMNFISINAIPNSVTSLDINRIHTNPNTFPQSLTHLELSSLSFQDKDHDNLIKMITSTLPQSLTSLSLPSKIKSLNITLPNAIKQVSFL